MSERPADYATLGEGRCLLGEGPTYDRHTDTAWWFDILDRKLIEHRFGDGSTHVHALPFMASALGRIDGDRQLVVAEDGLYIRDVGTGALTLHRPLEADSPATRSNDSRVHPSGAFWIGTMGKQAEEGAGAIYWYRKGEIRRLFDNISITNAICFSPDGATGYFTDTPTRQLMRVAIDPRTGLPTDKAEPFGEKSDAGTPDGAVVDAAGNLWVARWGGSAIEIISPDGALIETIRLPATQISCPAFVGSDARRMIATSAAVDIDDGRDGPGLDGATFVFDIGGPGRFEPDVVID